MLSDDQLLKARLKDAKTAAENKNFPRFVGFLNETEITLAKTFARETRAKVQFFGGYGDAVRQIICFLPDWADECDNFPIVPIKATYKSEYKLTHRDFLGALMSLGIVREKVGDIVCSTGETVFFLHSDIADFVLNELKKAGKIGINLTCGVDDFNFPLPEFQEITSTVASARLDCVVSALTGESREKANCRILQGTVLINSVECKNISAQVKENSSITIQKCGKFVIDSLSETTKKGRIKLKSRKLK